MIETVAVMLKNYVRVLKLNLVKLNLILKKKTRVTKKY